MLRAVVGVAALLLADTGAHSLEGHVGALASPIASTSAQLVTSTVTTTTSFDAVLVTSTTERSSSQQLLDLITPTPSTSADTEISISTQAAQVDDNTASVTDSSSASSIQTTPTSTLLIAATSQTDQPSIAPALVMGDQQENGVEPPRIEAIIDGTSVPARAAPPYSVCDMRVIVQRARD